MEVEHWVELDPFHTSIVNPVLGDEQVLDVELDRHTELLPIRQVSAPGTRKRKGDETIKSSEESTIAGRSSPQDEPCKRPLVNVTCASEILIASFKSRLYDHTQVASSPLPDDHERYVFLGRRPSSPQLT
jgi:hypothetical protein